MPFIGAAITPHTPLLLPSIGATYRTQTKRTARALQSVAQELYSARPDLILVLHPHQPTIPDAFTANVAETFHIEFTEFGDLATKKTQPGAVVFAHHLKEQAQQAGLPLMLTHEATVPYDVGVPVVLLTEHLPSIPILPMKPSTHDRQVQVSFGRLMAETFHAFPQRIYIIASAELSQHAAAAAPGGLRPEGAQFDTAIIKSLGKRGWPERLLSLDEDLVSLAEPCGFPVLLLLAGVLARQNVHLRKLSYEAPFGIGLLTAIIHAA